MIIREYKCNDCDTYFESSDADPACPQCSSGERERVFLTAPAVRDGKTSRTDTIMKELASDYGLSDMTNKDGKPVKQAPTGENAPQFAGQNHKVMGQLAKLGGNADNFSGVGASFAGRGPRTWNKVPAVRK